MGGGPHVGRSKGLKDRAHGRVEGDIVILRGNLPHVVIECKKCVALADLPV